MSDHSIEELHDRLETAQQRGQPLKAHNLKRKIVMRGGDL